MRRTPEGTVMTVEFELEGQQFVALNGGPHFTFTEVHEEPFLQKTCNCASLHPF